MLITDNKNVETLLYLIDSDMRVKHNSVEMTALEYAQLVIDKTNKRLQDDHPPF